MSFLVKSLENKDNKLSIPSKVTTLNPNAAEFVPSSLRFTNGNSKTDDTNRVNVPRTSMKVILDKSDSITSNNSDESRQFWKQQLPDDITPVFTVAEDFSRPEQLSLAGLSINDDDEALRFPKSMSKRLLHGQVSKELARKLEYSGSIFPEDYSTAFSNSATYSWDNRSVNPKFKGFNFKGDSSADFMNSFIDDHPIMEDSAISHVEFLALQFPGFSTDRLADMYYSNGCDLNMTIEILNQLEIQVDAGFTHNQNSKAAAAPNLTAIDFPALTGADAQNGFSRYNRKNIQRTQHLYSPSSIFHTNPVTGFSGNSYLLKSQYILHENKLQANMHSASRGEASDFARLRNECFEEAREAYLIGNMALAKKLGDKGKWFNLQLKEAHTEATKAREAIHRQRNPSTLELQDDGRVQERIINLHGLHVNEALHVLKHELSLLRNAARSGGRWLPVFICVGTANHTKGSRIPARLLPIAVEQLLSEEGLHYTQQHPGLISVIIR